MKKIKTNKITIFLIFVLFGIVGCAKSTIKEKQENSQIRKIEEPKSVEHQAIFKQLKTNDSLLFEVGFNKCDISQIEKLTSKDFELYHDQAGITDSKEAFMESVKGLCTMNYRATRELDENSLEVHLLKNNGQVYGAIQTGKHQFYAEEENKPKYLTSTAEFMHLWIKEEGQWKFKRVLSYNHEVAETE